MTSDRISNLRDANAQSVAPATRQLSRASERYQARRVTGTTIAFVNSNSRITNSDNGMDIFGLGDEILVQGSANNDGSYIVTAAEAGYVTVSPGLADESAGADIIVSAVQLT